jgi:hypothetical protein
MSRDFHALVILGCLKNMKNDEKAHWQLKLGTNLMWVLFSIFVL